MPPVSPLHPLRLLLAAAALAATASPALAEEAGLLAVVQARFAEGRFPQAAALAAAETARAPRDAAAWYWLGRARTELYQDEEAEQALERAVKLAPDHELAQWWYARVCLRRAQREANPFAALGLAKRGREAFEAVRRLNPANVQARLELMRFHLRAPGVAGGSLETAETLAREIAALEPYLGQFAQALLHLRRERPDDALLALTAAWEAAPTQLAAPLQALIVCVDLRRWDASAEWFERVRAVNPEEPGLLYQQAKITLGRGKVADCPAAEAALFRYLELPRAGDLPPPAAAWTRLGQLAALRGDAAEARRRYEEALRLDPKFPQAREALQDLKP